MHKRGVAKAPGPMYGLGSNNIAPSRTISDICDRDQHPNRLSLIHGSQCHAIRSLCPEQMIGQDRPVQSFPRSLEYVPNIARIRSADSHCTNALLISCNVWYVLQRFRLATYYWVVGLLSGHLYIGPGPTGTSLENKFKFRPSYSSTMSVYGWGPGQSQRAPNRVLGRYMEPLACTAAGPPLNTHELSGHAINPVHDAQQSMVCHCRPAALCIRACQP